MHMEGKGRDLIREKLSVFVWRQCQFWNKCELYHSIF